MSRIWTINGRFLQQSLTGVQRYAFEIATQMEALIDEGHPLAAGLQLDIAAPPGKEPTQRFATLPIRTVGRQSNGHLWEQLVLPRHLRGGLLSLCNSGPLTYSRQIACIHDVNTRSYPASYSRSFRSLYRFLHPALGRVSQAVATVSDYSKSKLIHYAIAPEDKIHIIPNGYQHAMRWQAQHSDKTRELADGRTVVVIGSTAPHKNIALLLKIAPELARADLRLAIVGLRDSKVFKDLQEGNGSAANVVWLGRLTDEEIAALLQDALCLAFPSFAEGFGIPALEAMSRNCPVVASDRSSLPEVCGEASLYASPTDAAAWTSQILRISNDQALREDLIARGQEQARKFSWRSSAEKYLTLMAKIDGLQTG